MFLANNGQVSKIEKQLNESEMQRKLIPAFLLTKYQVNYLFNLRLYAKKNYVAIVVFFLLSYMTQISFLTLNSATEIGKCVIYST